MLSRQECETSSTLRKKSWIVIFIGRSHTEQAKKNAKMLFEKKLKCAGINNNGRRQSIFFFEWCTTFWSTRIKTSQMLSFEWNANVTKIWCYLSTFP